MKDKYRLVVRMNNGDTATSKSMDAEDKADAVEAIKNINSSDFFWIMNKNDEVVSFNTNNISAILVQKVRRFILF